MGSQKEDQCDCSQQCAKYWKADRMLVTMDIGDDDVVGSVVGPVPPQEKHDELHRLKSELKDMKGRLKDALATAEAEKRRLVKENDDCRRYIQESTQALVTAREKEAASKEELKKMK
eukprot:scaffold19940_cov80-Skeletonema_menzelii.AAC.1